MSTRNGPISRRTVLRGVGAMLGLPLLEAMAPIRALADSRAKAPVRMAALYMPNGVNTETWTPAGAGSEYTLSPALEPLKDLKQDVLVFTDLMHKATDAGDGHYFKEAAFLTGTRITRTTGRELRCGGTSVDQYAAQHIGPLTRMASLELGTEAVSTSVDVNVGITAIYGGHISWSTPTTPVSKEINPKLAFERLFKTNGKDSAQTQAEDKSVLDLVLEDSKNLRNNVGHADQVKLDEYLDSVRSIERRIEFDAKRREHEVKDDPAALKEIEKLGERVKNFYSIPGHSGDHTEHVRLMLDIATLAFWTDTTRVSTFMFGNAVSGKSFSFLDGVKGGHHEISHHEGNKEKLEAYKRINAWHIGQFAYMLERLKSIKEGEGTLLDNSMILFGSALRDGNSHNPHNLPLVLGGRGGGTIRTGRHLVYEKDTPLCNLYMSMLSRMGAPVQRFGDSTGELVGLDDAGSKGTAG